MADCNIDAKCYAQTFNSFKRYLMWNIIASCLFDYVLAWKVKTSCNYLYVSQLSLSLFSLFFP